MARLTFSLYSTSGCHLCEQAETMLLDLFQTPGLLPPLVAADDDSDSAGVAVDIIDISDDDQLVARYGVRIPVFSCPDSSGNTRELDWPFQPDQLLRFIRAAVQTAWATSD
jgi:hypothetical protein